QHYTLIKSLTKYSFILFTAPAHTDIYALSLLDALPICRVARAGELRRQPLGRLHAGARAGARLPQRLPLPLRAHRAPGRHPDDPRGDGEHLLRDAAFRRADGGRRRALPPGAPGARPTARRAAPA